jgi:hypothetical protein
MGASFGIRCSRCVAKGARRSTPALSALFQLIPYMSLPSTSGSVVIASLMYLSLSNVE